MKRLLLLLAMFACFALPLQAAGDLNGEMLAGSWDIYAASELEDLDGVFYFAFVLGVTQATDVNSTLFAHVPGFSMARMATIVGHYIDKHRKDDGFNKEPAVNIVTRAVLEVFPPPEIAGQNI